MKLKSGSALHLKTVLPWCPNESDTAPECTTVTAGQDPHSIFKLNKNKLSSWMMRLISSSALSSRLDPKLLQVRGPSLHRDLTEHPAQDKALGKSLPRPLLLAPSLPSSSDAIPLIQVWPGFPSP